MEKKSTAVNGGHATARNSGASLSKVVFELEACDWHEHATESIWAEQLSDDKYRLENVPFYVYGVSYADIVRTKLLDGQNLVQAVCVGSGHSTYRIFLVKTRSDHFSDAWEPLRRLGCTYERATDYLIAVDVPPKTSIYEAYTALERGEAEDVWDFEEANCEHPLDK